MNSGETSASIRDHYRETLKTELLKRTEGNPGYSLRAFAKYLGIEPAQLSRVMNGKQNLSESAARRVADKILRSGRARELFVASAQLSTARRPSLREQALKKISRLAGDESAVGLTLEAIRAISDWQHVAIMDLTGVAGFEPRPAWIASYLGISEIEVKLAIERLLKLGLLEHRGGTLVKTSARLQTPSDTPNSSIRKFHRQMMEKAIAILESQGVAERHITGKTMAIRRGDVPRLKALIDEFNRGVSALNRESDETGAPCDALYQLNVQLFDLKNRRKT